MREYTFGYQSRLDNPRRREGDRAWDRFNESVARWFFARTRGLGPEVMR